jgi:prevent-host-death family protein
VLRTVTKKREPMLITHHGEVKLVIQDIAEYEAMQESLALLKILALGEESKNRGKSKTVKKAFADLRRRIEEEGA